PRVRQRSTPASTSPPWPISSLRANYRRLSAGQRFASSVRAGKNIWNPLVEICRCPCQRVGRCCHSQTRPLGLPAIVGLSSENAAHRVAVCWTTPDGEYREGVYIPRRDSNSLANHLVGGRLFSGEHHRASFDVHDD